MQRSKLTRREALGYGLRLLATAGQPSSWPRQCSQPQAPSQPDSARSPPKPPSQPRPPPRRRQRRAAGPGPKPAEQACRGGQASKRLPLRGRRQWRSSLRRHRRDAEARRDPARCRPERLRHHVAADHRGPTAMMCFDCLVNWRLGADGRWGPQLAWPSPGSSRTTRPSSSCAAASSSTTARISTPTPSSTTSTSG